MELRPEQLTVLRLPHAERFHRDLIAHLQRFFAEQTEQLGPLELSAWVGRVLTRGRAHGFRKGPDLCMFANLAMIFGQQFDTEPWALEVLRSGRYQGDASWRMRRLYLQGMRQLEDDDDDQR